MADRELRPSRVPPRPHPHLLETIAQLRHQRASNAALPSQAPPPTSSSLINETAAFNMPVDLDPPSPPPASSSSGRRRLRKVCPQEDRTYSNGDTLRAELEDLQDDEDTERRGFVDDLADSLGQLAIAKPSSSSSNVTATVPTDKPKIMDAYSDFIKGEKTTKLNTTAEKNVICLSDSDSLDDASSSHCFPTRYLDRDDDVEVLSQRTVPVSRRKNEHLQRKSPVDNETQLWDLADEEQNSGVEGITFVHGKSVYNLPERIAKILYPHQHDGIKWLWGLHSQGKGGILGDDMGLGKTMQIGAFLAGLFASGLIQRAMVVAPKTLIAHWSKELSFVGLGRKTKDYSGCAGTGRDLALQHVLQMGGILLTTYDVVRNNWKSLKGDICGRHEYDNSSEDMPTWDYMILDEGHLIKNPSTQRAKSLKEIPCAHRIVLSGTPIQNNLREMWALFDFCCPQLLGDKKEFKVRYEDAISSANSKDATDRQKRIGSSVAQDLRKRIAPFFLRRLKSEVFSDSADRQVKKLSRKYDIIVWLPLTELQRQLYTAFLESETAHQSLDGSALAALTVLKKICDHPSLLTQRAAEDITEGMENLFGETDAAKVDAMASSLASLVEDDESFRGTHRAISCKIAFIMTLLENLIDEGHRTLIFSQTRKMLDIIQKEITSKQYGFRRIDGTIKASDREKFVQEFQTDPDIPIFLLTSKVGGLGLTLTGANRVIIVDPAWNPSTDNQSVDRAYRIGQTLNVLVYRLMTCGTIEEKIYGRQVFKGGLFKVATEHKEQFRYFSRQELRELFTLPKTGFDISLTQQQLHEEHSSQYEGDEELRQHVKFLESQKIAGVSHHDLLFSKQAPELCSSENQPSIKWDSRKMEYGSACSQSESFIHPRDFSRGVNEQKKAASDSIAAALDQQKFQIWADISRLSQTLADKVTVSRLPDKGENLRRKLKDLTNQLRNIKYISSTKNLVSVVTSSTDDARVSLTATQMVDSNNAAGKCTENVADQPEHGLNRSSGEDMNNEGQIETKTSNPPVDFDDVTSKLANLNVRSEQRG